MGVNIPHVLKGLNEDQSWTLFEQVAFEGQGQMDPKLKVIGKDVAQKCKGVPLVIKCLGGLMRQNPNERYWSFVQENEIWKLLKEDDGVIPVLKLSYIHLPSHLKQCFAFCSILRKDYNIPKDRLILIWRAQGYIQSQIRNENIQDIGDEYFNDLLSRSFFQEEVKDENGNIIRCKMHDLIHDLALSVAKSSFSSMKDDKEKLPKATLNELRDLNDLENHLGIENLDMVRNVELESMEAILREKKRLQSLRLQWGPNIRGDNKKNELLLDNLEPHPNLKELTVFGYEGPSFSECPELQYLPEGTHQLTSLQELCVKNCPNLRALPDWVLNLTSLETLKIQSCSELHCLPEGTHRLTSLQELHVEDCLNLKALPNWIPNLTSLKTIDIWGCDKLQYLPEGIQHLTSLRSLSITGCPQLSERCKKETGIHWPHIAHIPYIYIEGN
ncbi:Leucine-rich repeat containing-like protein [Theobroma cacao]|uniref:Leucine-rich repeat containing-like protein n=1 Tax=Theobroma cacao TaxID=3641 RepID=A0A061F656_THECC|nr:Leucine-rich repeat containing-like protein [Theobroma cacao]